MHDIRKMAEMILGGEATLIRPCGLLIIARFVQFIRLLSGMILSSHLHVSRPACRAKRCAIFANTMLMLTHDCKLFDLILLSG